MWKTFLLLFSELDLRVPAGSYWKYSWLWSSTTSWVSFLASLTLYLDTEKLATKAEVENMIGLTEVKVSTIKLDVEEYLIGLTHLSNELVKFYISVYTYDVVVFPSSPASL